MEAKNQNQTEVLKHVLDMLELSHKAMVEKATKAVDCMDFEDYDGKMIAPKAIVTAVLESEVYQYAGKGTSSEKTIKKIAREAAYHLP